MSDKTAVLAAPAAPIVVAAPAQRPAVHLIIDMVNPSILRAPNACDRPL